MKFKQCKHYKTTHLWKLTFAKISGYMVYACQPTNHVRINYHGNMLCFHQNKERGRTFYCKASNDVPFCLLRGILYTIDEWKIWNLRPLNYYCWCEPDLMWAWVGGSLSALCMRVAVGAVYALHIGARKHYRHAVCIARNIVESSTISVNLSWGEPEFGWAWVGVNLSEPHIYGKAVHELYMVRLSR